MEIAHASDDLCKIGNLALQCRYPSDRTVKSLDQRLSLRKVTLEPLAHRRNGSRQGGYCFFQLLVLHQSCSAAARRRGISQVPPSRCRASESWDGIQS